MTPITAHGKHRNSRDKAVEIKITIKIGKTGTGFLTANFGDGTDETGRRRDCETLRRRQSRSSKGNGKVFNRETRETRERRPEGFQGGDAGEFLY